MRLNSSTIVCAGVLCLTPASVMGQSSPKGVKPTPQKFQFSGQTIRMVDKTRSPNFRKGDVKIYGVPGNPARIQTSGLGLSARLIVFNAERQDLVAAGRGSEDVEIKGELVPTKGGLPVRFAATCEQATFDKKKQLWSLEGNVKGFYETVHGRKLLDSEVVTITRHASRISVTQQIVDNVGGNAGT